MGSLQDFRNFSVAIQNTRTRRIAGTGFIVFTDGERVKIITAAHVVTDLLRSKSGISRSPQEIIGKRVGVHFFQPLDPPNAKRDRTARVVSSFSEFDDDAILLELDGADPRPPMLRQQAVLGAAEASKSHPYVTFGFAEIGREYPGGISDGLILGLSPSKIRGVYQCEMVQLQANNLGVRVQRGMSGSAVLDRYRNLVVGIVTEFLLPAATGVSWAANCKVLSFTPISLGLITDEAQSESISFAREAFDRLNYEYVDKPGLKLNHTPKPMKNWVGRQSLIAILDEYYWKNPQCKLVELVGFGGEGKSSLAQKWLERVISGESSGGSGRKPEGVFWWDFYYDKNSDGCIAQLLAFVAGSQDVLVTIPTPSGRVERIKKELKERGYLLVLDGFETMISQYHDQYGEVVNKDLANLLEFLTEEDHKSFCLVTSRIPLFGLANTKHLRSVDVLDLNMEEGMTLLRKIGVKADASILEQLVNTWAGHPLTLTVLGSYIISYAKGELSAIRDLPSPISNELPYERLQRLLYRYDQLLTEDERRFLQVFSAFRSPVDSDALELVFRSRKNPIGNDIAKLSLRNFNQLIAGLLRRGLIRASEPLRGYKLSFEKGINRKGRGIKKGTYIIHPLIRSYFYASLSGDERKSVNIQLKNYVHRMWVPNLPKNVTQMQPLFDELYYMCEAGLYDKAFRFYRKKIAKEDQMPLDEPSYLSTALLACQTDADLLATFFKDHDWTSELRISKPEARADILVIAGVALDYLGDTVNSIQLFERSAMTGIECEEWDYAVWSYENICTTYTSMGRLNEALGAANLALKYVPLIKGWARESVGTYTRMGWTKLLLGDVVSAFEMLDQVDTVVKNNKRAIKGYPFSAEKSWRSNILAKTGRYKDAIRVAKENLATLKEHGWLDDVGQNRVLASIYLALGRHSRALKLLDESIETLTNKGMKEELVQSLFWRGNCFLEMEQFGQAREDLEHSLELAQRYRYVWELDIRNSLIRCDLLTASSNEIYANMRKQLLLVQSAAIVSGYKWAEADSLFLLGELERLYGTSKTAKDYYRQCLAIREAISDPNTSKIKDEYLLQ